MPVFEVELPGGNRVQFEGDQPPSQDDYKQLMIASLPKYGLGDVAATFETTGPEGEKFVQVGLSNFLKSFRRAKVGEEFSWNGSKVIKASENEFINPEFEDLRQADREEADRSSKGGAFARSFGLNAGPAAAGAAAMGAAAQLTAPLRGMGPVGAVASLGIPILAGAAGAILAKKGEDKIVESALPQLAEREQKDAAQQPGAVQAGGIAANAPFFGVGKLEQSVAKELAKRAVPAAIGGGIQGAEELANAPKGEVMGEGAGKRIAESALANAVFNEPTKLGEKVIERGANNFATNKITSMLANVTSKNPTASNQTANEIALEPAQTQPQPSTALDTINRQVGTDQPVKSAAESAAVMDSELPAKSAESSADAMQANGLVANTPEQQASIEELAKTAQPTPHPSQVQKQIEQALGLTKAKETVRRRLTEEAGRLEEVLPEADRRTAEQNQMDNARKSVDEAIGIVEGTKNPADDTQLAGALVGEHLRDTGEIPSENPQEVVQQAKDSEAVKQLNAEKQLDADNGEIPAERGLGSQAGFISPGLAKTIATPTIGAIVGYQFGDTPEEKRANALRGALIASGGALGLKAAQTLARDNPAFYEALKAKLVKPEETPTTPSLPEGASVQVRNLPVPGRPEIPPLRYVEIGKPGEEPLFRGTAEDAAKQGFNLNLPEGVKDGTYTAAQLAPQGAKQFTFDAFASRTPPKEEIQPNATPTTETTETPPVTTPETPPVAQTQTKVPAVEDRVTKLMNWMENTTAGKVLKHAVGEVEGNIRAVSPRIFGVLRQYGDDLNVIRSKFQDETLPLSRLTRKALPTPAFDEFSLKLMNGDIDGAKAMVENLPEGPAISKAIDDSRAILEQAHSLLSDSREGEVGYVENYFPRKVADYNGLVEFLGKQAPGQVDKAIKQATIEKGEPLTQDERESVINNLVQGMIGRGAKPSMVKQRQVQTIESDVGKFYEPFDVSMEEYLNKVARYATNRAYFGKFEPGDSFDGQGGNFGKVINEEVAAGNLDAAKQNEVIGNLNARLKQDHQFDDVFAKIGSKVRTLQTAAFLGDMTTAVAQFGDIFNTAQRFGLKSTIKGYLKRPIQIGRDLKIHEGNVETTDLSRNRGFLERATGKVMKFTIGLSDQFNKGGSANAIAVHFHDVVTHPESAEFKRLNRVYSEIYPERWPAMVKDLRSKEFGEGKLNDNTRFFVFNELANMQPLGASQMARGYNEASPFMKAAYGLKSYMIKQLNIMRTDGWEKMKDPRTRGEGLAFLASYAAIVAGGQSFAVSWLRDKLLDRDADASDYFVGGLLQLGGLNRYTLYKAKEGDYGKLAAETLLPIFGVGQDFTHDLGLARDAALGRRDSKGFPTVNGVGDFLKQSDMVQYIPGVGRELYWRYGHGATKEAKKANRPGDNTLGVIESMVSPNDLKTPRK